MGFSDFLVNPLFLPFSSVSAQSLKIVLLLCFLTTGGKCVYLAHYFCFISLPISSSCSLFSPLRSLKTLLVTLFPHYPWQVWLFGSKPKKYFENQENRQNYLAWIGAKEGRRKKEWARVRVTKLFVSQTFSLFITENQLCISKPEEWYEVSLEHIRCNSVLVFVSSLLSNFLTFVSCLLLSTVGLRANPCVLMASDL